MKQLNVVFEDKEYRFLKEIKNRNKLTNWHDTILEWAKSMEIKK